MTRPSPQRTPSGPHRTVSPALLQRVGPNVSHRRKRRGMTQQELARYLGGHFCASLVSDVECGRRNLTLASLERLAKGLNCCESDLLARLRTERVS